MLLETSSSMLLMFTVCDRPSVGGRSLEALAVTPEFIEDWLGTTEMKCADLFYDHKNRCLCVNQAAKNEPFDQRVDSTLCRISHSYHKQCNSCIYLPGYRIT